MSKKHSDLFPPSGADRWMNCTASAKLCAEINVDMSNKYSEQGRKGHSVAEKYLKLSLEDGDIVLPVEQSEFYESVKSYLETIFLYISLLDNPVVKIEEYREHKSLKYLGGTADCVVYDNENLFIIDYKNGTQSVDPNSWQLICYALIWHDRQKEIETVITQPNDIHGKNFKNKIHDPYNLVVKFSQIMATYQDILENRTSFKTGDWCTYCKASIRCPKVSKSLTIIEENKITKEDLATAKKILDHETAIKEAIKTAKAIVKQSIETGQPVEGYKIVKSFGHRKWLNPDIVKKELKKSGFNPEDYQSEPKLQSPNQLKKVLPKEFIDKQVQIPYKGLTLVPESDRRKAYDPAEDFEDLTK